MLQLTRWNLTRSGTQGVCDRTTGACTCDAGFEGNACDRMSCPYSSTALASCSGRGVCKTLRLMAQLKEDNGDADPQVYGSTPHSTLTWDADKIQGCVCDKAYHTYASGKGDVSDHTGYDCSERTCPTGDNSCPRGELEQQTITCTATGGTFTLTFRQRTTAAVSFGATLTQLKAALEALDT